MGAQSPHKVFWRVQCFGDMVPFSVLLIYHTCVHGTFTVFQSDKQGIHSSILYIYHIIKQIYRLCMYMFV